jgi:N-acetylmuramoyl-L-alanine amidase
VAGYRGLIAVVYAIAAFGLIGRPGAPAAAEPHADYPVATDSRIGGDDNQIRFVMDFSRKVDLRAFTLADPYRVVVDLPQVVFNLPPKSGTHSRGLVKAFRFGLIMQGGSRIVFDLNKPARIDRAFSIDATAGQPARLVLDLVATDRESFMRTVARQSQPQPAATTGAIGRDPAAAPDDKAKPIVVLDPGHGGIDNGTVASTGVAEKSIVLDFALRLRERLERSGKYHVVMTRTDDTFIPLADRVRMARIRQAALFISIHADALKKGEGEAQGATVYTLSETASDAVAAQLAEDENRADIIAGIDLSHEPGDVADILIDLAQRETKSYSVHFAKSLVADMRKVARMHKHPMKSAGFRVLKAPDVPSVLIELGYVSSKDDLQHLTSDSWQDKTAAAINQAIDRYFAARVAGPATARTAR